MSIISIIVGSTVDIIVVSQNLVGLKTKNFVVYKSNNEIDDLTELPQM